MTEMKVRMNTRLAIANAVLKVSQSKNEAKVILDNCCQNCTLLLLNEAIINGAHFTGAEITDLARNMTGQTATSVGTPLVRELCRADY